MREAAAYYREVVCHAWTLFLSRRLWLIVAECGSVILGLLVGYPIHKLVLWLWPSLSEEIGTPDSEVTMILMYTFVPPIVIGVLWFVTMLLFAPFDLHRQSDKRLRKYSRRIKKLSNQLAAKPMVRIAAMSATIRDGRMTIITEAKNLGESTAYSLEFRAIVVYPDDHVLFSSADAPPEDLTRDETQIFTTDITAPSVGDRVLYRTTFIYRDSNDSPHEYASWNSIGRDRGHRATSAETAKAERAVASFIESQS